MFRSLGMSAPFFSSSVIGGGASFLFGAAPGVDEEAVACVLCVVADRDAFEFCVRIDGCDVVVRCVGGRDDGCAGVCGDDAVGADGCVEEGVPSSEAEEGGAPRARGDAAPSGRQSVGTIRILNVASEGNGLATLSSTVVDVYKCVCI